MLRWSALTNDMEARPLSLSRLQVLCHSLSKVLFKLSLTLLVRYRSSYSVFNFGRHIPAASHCIPKQCYSLVTVHEAAVSGSTGYHRSRAQYSHQRLFQHCLLCTLNFTSPPTNHKQQFVPHFDAFNTPIRH